MADITAQVPRGTALPDIRGKWGGLVALGVLLMIAGAVASVSLLVAPSPSLLHIGAMMFAGGILEFVDAFAMAGWQRKSLRLLAGLAYGFAGMIVVLDPLLGSVSLILALGILLGVVGILRVGSGIQHRDEEGQDWIVAAGVSTLIAGAVVIVAWPGISLWLIGAILTVDLIVQGWSFIALGLAAKPRRQHG